uniref:Uncharacterized protein n=1 Tax=Geladintestivirus 1 TaxID=3233133 RepID=A0AAU8MI44_9CAUD
MKKGEAFDYYVDKFAEITYKNKINNLNNKTNDKK